MRECSRVSLVISVNNTDTGVTARVEVVQDEQSGGQHITDLQITTVDGRPLRADDLLLLEQIGLPIPQRPVGQRGSVLVLGSAPEPPGEVIPDLRPAPAKAAKAPAKKAARPAKKAVKKPVGRAGSKPGVKKTAPPPAAVAPPVPAVQGAVPPAQFTEPAPPADGAARQEFDGAKGRQARAVNAAAGKGRPYRLAPPVDRLQALMAEHGGPGKIAEVLDVPAHTVTGWLRKYRSKGHEFPVSAPVAAGSR